MTGEGVSEKLAGSASGHPARDVLDSDGVAPLFEALRDPSAEVRVAVFEALTRLPLAPSDWIGLGAYASWAFDSGDPNERLAVIDAAPSVPVGSVQERVAR